MNNQLNMSYQSAMLRRELIEGCTSKTAANRLKEVIASLYSAYVSLHLQYYVQFLSPRYRKDMDILEQMEHLSNQPRAQAVEGQRGLGLFSLEKSKVKEDLTALCNCLTGV